MTFDLFDNLPEPGSRGGEHSEAIGPGAVVLRGFALSRGSALREAIEQVQAEAPFRHLVTPGGFRMSVAMTNCGTLGWVSDASGYRYDPIDPDSGRPWPAMPAVFTELAREAAAAAGYPGFAPDACLINRYTPGTRLSLHRTATSAICARRSSPYRWACPQYSCSAGRNAPTVRHACASLTAISPSGAGRAGSSITASRRSPMAITR